MNTLRHYYFKKHLVSLMRPHSVMVFTLSILGVLLVCLSVVVIPLLCLPLLVVPLVWLSVLIVLHIFLSVLVLPLVCLSVRLAFLWLLLLLNTRNWHLKQYIRLMFLLFKLRFKVRLILYKWAYVTEKIISNQVTHSRRQSMIFALNGTILTLAFLSILLIAIRRSFLSNNS